MPGSTSFPVPLHPSRWRGTRVMGMLAVLLGLAIAPRAVSGQELLPAAPAVSLEELLERHAQAHGFPRTEPDPRAIHFEATVEAFGLAGRLETWSEPPVRIWTRLELGPLTLESGFDGTHGWILDRNGALREAAGAERAGMLLDALIQTGGYVLHEPPVPLQRDAIEADGDPTTVELRLHPLGSDPQTLVLDATTYQVRSTHWHTGQAIERTVYDDHRWVEGLLLPHHLIIHVGSNTTLDVTVVRVERTAPRGEVAYAPPRSGAPQDVRFREGSDSGPLLMSGGGDHILLRGRINGRHEGTFLLDTGAGGNILHQQRLSQLGLTPSGDVEATGVAGEARASFVDVDLFELGNLSLLGQSWMALDFTNLEPVLGSDVLGVLGYDALSRVVVEIDYLTRTVKLSDPGSFRPRPDAVPIPLRLDSNVPTAQVQINGRPGWVHVDTGSNNTLDLTGPFVEEHRLLETQEELTASGLVGLGGLGRSLRGRLDHLQLQAFEFEGLPVYFHEEGEGIFANRAVAGILGAGILRQFHCAFDYSRSTLWLVANGRYVPPTPQSPSGVELLEDEGAIAVGRVQPDSPGAQAGLRPGDRILGFNNRSVNAEDLPRVRAALNGASGRRIKLHLERRGHSLHRSVWLPSSR